MKYIKEYSKKLVKEVGKRYNERTLRRIRQFYLFLRDENWSTMSTKLTWSHYIELLPLKNDDKIMYYINQCITFNLSRNELREKIKNKNMSDLMIKLS